MNDRFCTASMKNRLIIFDCFGVIFGEIAPIFFSRYFSPEEAAILKDKFFIPADLGLVTYEELFVNMAEELKMPKEDILKEWEELICLNEPIVPVIRELGKTADITLLSNAPLGFVERLFEEYDLSDLFDRIFISCNIKMAKPDPGIYRYCISQINKDYDEIYMIDDNPANLEPLPAIGIKPVRFTDIENMLKDLNNA